MRAGKKVSYHPGVLGLCAEILPDPHDPGGLLRRGAGKVDSGKASGVGLSRTGARNHGLILAVVESGRYLMSRLTSFLSSQRRPLVSRNACTSAITRHDSSRVD
jgi:hypothetical protein